MTQTALNDIVTLTPNTWTLISEADCTFTNEGTAAVEIRGDTSTPELTEFGVSYAPGYGEALEIGTLSRYAGVTATGIYAISRKSSVNGRLFVSRAAVA
jgi:hypothetical protein